MRQQYTFTKQGSMVPLKNVEDVNMQYHLDCNDDVKTETVWMRCKKREESIWLHPVDPYLVCLNWNLFC
jgi:hypothetical protein